MVKYNTRILTSFSGECPMNCKHCYTYELPAKTQNNSYRQIVDEISEKTFDIIYLSQSYENFFDEEKGICLCEELYKKYKKDLFIITRSSLSDKALERLKVLNQVMMSKGNNLFFAVSLCADQSYYLTEDEQMCPPPEKRLRNLEKMAAYGIRTILLLRPIFPDNIIPIDECIGLIEKSKNYIGAVVSSGLIVTDGILDKLSLDKECLRFLPSGKTEYLQDLDPDKAQYVDVEKELYTLESFCKQMEIPFFRHSLPALNYLKQLSLRAGCSGMLVQG